MTKRSIETGKVFNLEVLRNQGRDISPYLVVQKWENFVQIKERVYPMLIIDFYHNAQPDDFKTGIVVTYAGDKEIHLTEALFVEALEIPTENRFFFKADWFHFPTSHSCIQKNPSSRVTASNLLDHVKNSTQVVCAQSCSKKWL